MRAGGGDSGRALPTPFPLTHSRSHPRPGGDLSLGCWGARPPGPPFLGSRALSAHPEPLSLQGQAVLCSPGLRPSSAPNSSCSLGRLAASGPGRSFPPLPPPLARGLGTLRFSVLLPASASQRPGLSPGGTQSGPGAPTQRGAAGTPAWRGLGGASGSDAAT